MSNKYKDLQKLFIPSDIMPIGMILIGIIISIFISEIAIKLIGISISILGIVVLLMKLTTRMSSAIETRFKSNPPPNFKITVKKSPEAKRQVIENFNDGNDDQTTVNSESSINETVNNTIEKKIEPKTMGEEEGFRIVNKQQEKEDIDFENEKKTQENSTVNKNEERIEQKKEINNEKENSKEISYNKSLNKFRKREINIPTHGLLEEMPIFKDHPDKEFELFINRILMAIRSVSNTRTAAYFFYNSHKNEIILNSYASDSKKVVSTKTKFVDSTDIVSQIARSMKPEILTDINPAAELDLLPYYNSNSGTNSFIGIPVIYDKNVIGVLTADSKHTDAYDTFMVNFLSHFTKLISGLIRSYSDKYDLAQDSKYLKVLNDFDKLCVNSKINEIHINLVKMLNEIINAKNIYSIEIQDINKNYNIICVSDKQYADFEEGFEFYNEDSLLTESIVTNTEIYENNPEELVRINKGEDFSSGFFYVVPISTSLEKFGAIAIEGTINSKLDKEERLFIKTLVNKSASKIEKLKLYQLVQIGFDKDPISGLLTDISFKKELDKEITRAKIHNFNSSIATICLDDYQSIDSSNKQIIENILIHINESLKTTIDSIDAIGRINNTLVLILSGKNSQAAKLWAERVRNKVASESLIVGDRRFNITISIGICEFNGESNSSNTITCSEKAMNVSKEKANSVSVYS